MRKVGGALSDAFGAALSDALGAALSDTLAQHRTAPHRNAQHSTARSRVSPKLSAASWMCKNVRYLNGSEFRKIFYPSRIGSNHPVSTCGGGEHAKIYGMKWH